MFCCPGISSPELFGPIRTVCRRWQVAVDAMPCASARREVALVCAGMRPPRPTAPASTATHGSEDEIDVGAESGLDTAKSPAQQPCWWDVVRSRLVRGGGLCECDAERVLRRLEWAVKQEEELGGELDGDRGEGIRMFVGCCFDAN